VRAESDVEDLGRMAAEDCLLPGGALAGGRTVPESQLPVRAGRGQAPALRIEENGLHDTRLLAEAECLPTAAQVPDTDGPVVAARNEPLAVRVERHGMYAIQVAYQGLDQAASARVVDPDVRFGSSARDGQSGPVAAEGHSPAAG